MADRHFTYRGGAFPDPCIKTVTYRPEYFDAEIRMESDAFESLRRANGMEPARLDASPPAELEEIRAFFEKNADSFFFLFTPSGELVGSVLHLGNYIQCLCVSPGLRRQGWGEKLSMHCVNRILAEGHGQVELHVMDGNVQAEKLYRKLGFREE